MTKDALPAPCPKCMRAAYAYDPKLDCWRCGACNYRDRR